MQERLRQSPQAGYPSAGARSWTVVHSTPKGRQCLKQLQYSGVPLLVCTSSRHVSIEMLCVSSTHVLNTQLQRVCVDFYAAQKLVTSGAPNRVLSTVVCINKGCDGSHAGRWFLLGSFLFKLCSGRAPFARCSEGVSFCTASVLNADY